MSSRRSVVLFAVLSCTALLGGADVTYYEEALPTSMNPLFARTMVDHRTHELLFDRVTFHSPINQLLRSRVLVEDAADVPKSEVAGERAVKVWFREGIRWHDGEKVGPWDLCFTIRAMLDPATASTQVDDARESLASCEVVKSENAAIVRFTRDYRQPLEHLQFSLLPEHMFTGTAVRSDSDFSMRPIGSGPMRGARSGNARSVSLTAFGNGNHSPQIPTMSVVPMGDPYIAVKTLLGGGVQGVLTVPPALRGDVEAADDVALKRYDLRSWWFIAVNTTRGPLADKRVRQALDLTLDRSQLEELTVSAPEAENSPIETISGPFVPTSPYYNRQVPTHPRAELGQARDLMKAAGAVENLDRWFWKDKAISLKVGMNASLDAEAKDLLNQVGNQLQAGHFDRTGYLISDDEWSRSAVTGKMTDFDLLIGKWSFGQNDEVGSLFHTRAAGKGDRNLFGYSNAAVDSLLADYDAAKTDTEARDAYHGLHTLLADELPYLFLWRLDTKSAWRNEVHNVTIAPYYYFTTFDGWRFDAAAPTTGN